MPMGAPALPAIAASTVQVVSVLSGSPDTVVEVERARAPARLTAVDFTNTAAPGNYVQIFLGIEVYDSASWTPFASVYLDGGENFRWRGNKYMAQLDKVVAYADVTARGNVSPELEEVTELNSAGSQAV